MQDRQREILNQVASGAISAEEGAARIESLDSDASPAGPVQAPPTTGSTVRQVRLVTRFGNTEIVGDPSVAVAVADGPHKARQDGDTLFIDQSPLDDDATFEFSRPLGRVRVQGFQFGQALIVRMNPALALSAKVQAGNLRIDGVHGALSCDVQAGNCDITDFASPINLNVTAGEVAAAGRLDGGISSVDCKMGEVRVDLDRRSSVHIRARTTMGDVAITQDGATSGHELTVGSGQAKLDVRCTMGSVHVAVR